MNEIFKVDIQLKKSIQNIQITLDQIPYVKERIEPILDCPVYCLSITLHHILFFKLTLFKNCIKQYEMNL